MMKAAYNSIRIPPTKLYNLPLVIASVIAVLISISFFFLIMKLNVTNVERKLEDQLQGYVDIFSRGEFPNNCLTRYFPYFYNAEKTMLAVTDRDVEDWNELHQMTGESGEFDIFNPNSAVSTATLPCGAAITPYSANKIVLLHRQKETGPQYTGYDFSLRFARDELNKNLYMLGKIIAGSDDHLPERFKLILHHTNRETETYHLTQNEDEVVTWAPLGFYHGNPDNHEYQRDMIENPELTLAGRWWDIEESGRKNLFLEIQLSNLDKVTAIEIAAEKFLGGRYVSRTGTEYPVPLYEDIKTFQITRHLPQHIHYELYLELEDSLIPASSYTLPPEHRTNIDSLLSDNFESTSLYNYLKQSIRTLYKLYFFAVGYAQCSDSDKVRNTETGRCVYFHYDGQNYYPYRLRVGEILSPPENKSNGDYVEMRVFLEETPVISFWDSIFSIAYVIFIALLIVVLGFVMGRWKQALNAQNRAISELEKINQSLAVYDDIFLHEGARRLKRLMKEINGLLRSAGIHESKEKKHIDSLVLSLTERLKQSTKIFKYEHIVRTAIAKHGHERFSLLKSIKGIISESGYKDEVLLETCFHENEEPLICATSSMDSTELSPDHYFVQAIEKVIDNAVNYRTPGTPIKVSLKTEHLESVIEVTNESKPVPEDKLDAVFKFGSRYTGAVDQPVGADSSTDSMHVHLGIGLFITNQIVCGYEGSCQMKNNPDGRSVTIIVRLPCTCSRLSHKTRQKTQVAD